ncbi:MAG: hypothetical protein JXB05_35840 [Myxococcaceae bacterium]|nr:hypothetical protein [Myxococcaceae bacterium]
MHRYYPSNIRSTEEGYGSSEQYQRLLKARQEASSGNVHMGDAQLIDCLFTDDRW